MAVRIDDTSKLKSFLYADPLRNAVAIQRVFLPREKSYCLVDSEDFKALAVVEDTANPEETRSLAVAGERSEAVRAVVSALPRGKYWMQLVSEDILAILRERMRLGWYASAWLLSLDRGGLKARRRLETREVETKWAQRIARIWSPDWDASNYVRNRIEHGPSSGVYVDGELVAWGLTHFETENVSMLGFLNVLPEHRGRGYAESITADMAEKVFARGRTPACHVYEHNSASLDLMGHSGFRRVCKQVWGDAVTHV